MKRLVGLVLILVVAVGIAAIVASTSRTAIQTRAAGLKCVARHHFSTVHKGTLTAIGTITTPNIIQVNGKLKGVDIALIKDIAKMECLKLKVVLTSSAAVLESVRKGLGDVGLGGWYITPERGKVLGQTAPLFCDPTAIVSKAGYETLDQLKGKNVAVVQGTLFVAELQKDLGSGVKVYQSSDAAFADVIAGRVDAWVGGYGEGIVFARARPDAHVKVKAMKRNASFTPSLHYGEANLPYPKGNKALGRALSADIHVLKGNGTLRKIYKTVPLPLVGDKACPKK